VFVPKNRMAGWAELSSTNSVVLADARAKGYYDPIPADDVEKLKSANATDPSFRDADWRAQVERYEARASMGDPNAMSALALIFGRGLGVTNDASRAGIWANEAHDTLKFSKMVGVNDPVAAGLLDAFVNFNDANSTGDSAAASQAVLGKVLGLFGERDPFDSMTKNRSEVLRYLDRNTLDYRKARTELMAWRKDLDRLASAWTAGEMPAEIGEMRSALEQVEKRILAQSRGTAEQLIRDTETMLTSLRQKIPAKKSDANQPKP
jgi:hypothetical protein